MLDNCCEGRWKELDKMMKFGLRLMKKSYQSAALCLNILQNQLPKKKHEAVRKKKKEIT